MSLFTSLRKPAWQSGSADRRLESVTADDDAALRDALPALARQDPDQRVRQAALRRCDDPALYAEAMASDGDNALRAWARQRWLAAVLEGRLELSSAALATLRAPELEQLATTGASAALRMQVLPHCLRPGFLAERALADPDPGIRLALVDRIDQPATLDRLAERARKSDKQVARRARDRARDLRLAAGDDTAHRERAEKLCQQLEDLLRSDASAALRESTLAEAERAWSAALASGQAPALLQSRFDGARAVLRQQLQPPAPAPEPDPGPAPTPEHELAPESGAQDASAPGPADLPQGPHLVGDDTAAPAPPSPEELAAQARLAATVAAHAERAQRERELTEQRDRERATRQAAELQRLASLEAAVDAGDLGRARPLLAELDPKGFDAPTAQRWQALQARLKTLMDWEHWANNKVRARLCEEIEQLAGTGLHPDALAGRIREAQQEWRRLDALEARPSDAPPTGLDRRFRALCARVLKPAREFFDKRDALRRERAQVVERFLDQAPAALEDLELAALLELQRHATGHLRTLAELAPKDQRVLAARLRTVLDGIRPRVDQAFEQAEASREALIREAEGLSGQVDGRRVAADARSLGQRWKALGKGRPARDQQQWRRFRQALDQVFGDLDRRREQADAERAGQVLEAASLVAELEQLVDTAGESPEGAQGRVRELRERWQSLDVTDRALADRLDAALTRQREGLRSAERERLRERWQAQVDAGPAVADDGPGPGLDQARALLFEVEALAGIEPLADEAADRRRWQLQRLQQHLQGGRERDPDQLPSAVTALLGQWQQLEPLGAGERERLAGRLSRALERLAARG